MRDAGAMRTFLALVAAAVGVEICLYQQHFVLEMNAASFAEMLRHRCGLVMVAAVMWMVVEVGAYTRTTKAYHGWDGKTDRYRVR